MTLALLRDACKDGSLQKLKDNLKICQEQDIDPFSNFFSRPETLFHIASENKASSLEILEELVTEFRYWSSKTHRKYKGSGINSYLRDSLNSEGYTALHCACKSNKSDYVYVFVKELRFYGVYCRSCKRVPFECECISFEMMYEYTPFEVACLHCCSDIALFLLKKCQRVFVDFSNGIILAYDSGFRDFIISVCRKHKVTVKVLNSLCHQEKFEIVDFCIKEHLCKQEGKQLVHMAASNGEVDLLRYCVKKKGFDIASVDKSGVNILHIACSANKIECVKFVLESNYLSLAVKKNRKGERPINLSESEEIIELIKTRLRLNELHSICLHDETSYFMISLDKSKLITEQYISEQDAVGNTPLHYACENGQVYIIEAILSQTSVNIIKAILSQTLALNLNLQNDDGNTAVHLLVCCLSKTIRELYASDKYQLSQLGSKTAQVRHIITSLKEMINHSSFNFSLCNKKEETVAFLILTQLVLTDKRFDGLLSLIPRLVQKSYDSKWFSKDFLRIISHYCQHCYRSRYLKKNYRGKSRVHPFVKLLKDTTSPEFMLDSTIRDSKGNTCLHYAAACNWSELVIYLVTSTKCDVSIKNQDDKTPLQCVKPLCQNISSLLESCSIYEHLIENGAQINSAPVDKDANTILNIACIAKSPKLLKMLIELDADIKKMVMAVNKAGKTPLHLLCSRSNYFVSVECFELLLKVPDVDVMCRTKSGRTPLEILTENVNKKLIVYERIRKSVRLIVRHDTFKPEMYIKPEYLEIWCKIGITKFVEQIISSDETLVNRVNDHNQNLLHFACFNFNSDVFDFVLQKSSGELVTAPDHFGFTPFHCICWRVWKLEKLDKIMSLENFISSTKAHNLLEMIKTGLPMFRSYNRNELIKAILSLTGIDPNLRNCFPLNCIRIEADNVISDQRNTKLHIACKSPLVNEEEIISLLSQSETDISITNNENQTALHVLIENANFNINDMYNLFKSHHSYNSSLLSIPDSSGNTCLHLACKHSKTCLSIVKDICDDQVDLINIKNKEGYTPLHLVTCQHSKLKVYNKPSFEALLEDILFHIALEVAEHIISIDESTLNALNNQKQTALHFNCFLAVIYPNCNLAKQDNKGNNPIHYLFLNNLYQKIFMDSKWEELVQNETFENSINQQNEDGNTFLHLACMHMHNDDYVETIIDSVLSFSSCDIMILNNEKKKAFDYCSLNAFVAFCLKHKYLTASVSNGRTALHLACRNNYLSNNVDFIKILSEAMDDINIQDDDGLTPFHCYRDSSIKPSDDWQYLVSHPSFNPNVQDNTGCTALHYICRSYHPNISLAKELLANEKTNVKIKNSNGNTCFHLISPCDSELINLFQDCIKQNPFCLLLNPIHELCSSDLQCLQVCTLSGSPLANIDSKQNTPLHIACRAVCPPFIKKLLQKCKKYLSDFPTNKSNQTPLHMLALGVNHHESSCHQFGEPFLFAQRKKLQRLRTHDWYLLLKCGINKQDNFGNTALHYTCQSQNTLLLKALTISKLCDFSISNNAGELPLTIAMKTGSRSFFLKVLIKYFESQDQEQLAHYYKTVLKDGAISMNPVKCILTGPPGAGKSTLKRRLLGESVSNISVSTGVADSPQVIAIRNISQEHVTVGDMKWTPVDCRNQVEALLQTASSKVADAIKYLNVDNERSGLVITERSKQPIVVSIASHSKPFKSRYSTWKQKINRVPTKTHLTFERQIKELRNLANSIPSKKSKLGSTQKFNVDVLEKNPFVRIIDTGGQPELHELLPFFITGPAVNLLVFSLEEPLEKHYLIQYRNADSLSLPYESYLNHEEMIFRSLSSIACLGNGIQLLPEDECTAMPAAFLIATHTDKVENAVVKKVNEHLKISINSGEIAFSEIICDYSDTQVIFAVNNLDEKCEEIDVLREKLFDAIRRFKPIDVPLSWLVLSIKLQVLTEKKKIQSVIKYEKCFEIGKSCGIFDEFEKVLWFFHNAMGIVMYFPQIPELKSVVIVDLQAVFDCITYLISSCFLFKTVGSKSVEDMFSKSGQFTLSSLNKVLKKVNFLTLNAKQIIALLLHLNIISSIENDTYFMPAALKPIHSISEPTSNNSPPPLLVSFKCGYCPVGVFTGLVAYLLSKEHWELIKCQHFRNKIAFKVGPCYDEVTLIARSRYFEIWLCRKQSQKSFSLANDCKNIRENVNNGIIEVTKSLHYKYQSKHYFGFMCPCESSPSHPAIYKFEPPQNAECILEKIEPLPLIDHGSHLLWYGKEATVCIKDDIHNISQEILNKELDCSILDKVHKHFRSFTKWDELGLELGLYKPTIEVIKKDKKDNTSEQNMEMLTRWLKMEDKVEDKGGPTWNQLITALRGIDDGISISNSIVKELRDKKVNDN